MLQTFPFISLSTSIAVPTFTQPTEILNMTRERREGCCKHEELTRRRNKSFTLKCISTYRQGKAEFGPVRAMKSCIGSIRKLCTIELASITLLKHTAYVMHQQVEKSTIVRCACTVFMCFVFIWERTATCATYRINWLVFLNEMKSVYSAVRTGSLNKAVCATSLKG